MDVGWPRGLPTSAALWDGERTIEQENYRESTDIAVTIQGQQTVQEIVTKATDLFRHLQHVRLSGDAAQSQTQNAKIEELLNCLKEQFTKLRALYDESSKRVDASLTDNLEADIPMAMSDSNKPPDMEVPSERDHLQMEHDALKEKLKAKNQHIKQLMDSIRTLIWDINTMMSIKPN